MQALKNAWYAAVWGADLEPGALVRRRLLGEDVVLFRSTDGTPRVLADACAHKLAPLHQGTLLPDGRLRCNYHGLVFDSEGQCVHNPHGAGQIPPAMKVQRYAAIERHSMVWVWMGDAPADPAQVPDFSVLDRGLPGTKFDHLTMQADYQLINDNLLDLSHVSFLHRGLLGNQETENAEIEVTQTPNSVSVTRIMRNAPPPGLFALMYKKGAQRVDVWTTIRWTAPGTLLNDTVVCDPGQPPEDGTGIFGVHLLTPQDEHTTLYHFTSVRKGPQYVAPEDLDEVRRKLSELRRYAFEEQDAPMIAGQHEILAQRRRNGQSVQPVLLNIDAGPLRARRLLEGLISAEGSRAGEAASA